MDDRLRDIYYSPRGYWRGLAAVEKLAKAAQVNKTVALDFLNRQAIWQIYLPPPKRVVRPHFSEQKPNAIHQADLLYLPHDRISPKKLNRYALTVVDVASRYKAAEPLTVRSAPSVALALESDLQTRATHLA